MQKPKASKSHGWTPAETGLAPGLYLVSTPIGSARDITLRALDVLATADVLAAEDTRTLRRLMEIHGIALRDRPLISYHDHNGARQRPRLLAMVAEGRSVAYSSDAGTPLIADPGFALVRDAVADDLPVTAAPGPVAAIVALTLSGLPTDRFAFAGFPPTKAEARRRALAEIGGFPGTVVFYESGKRCSSLIREIGSELGERPVAVCRELTKRFEEVVRGTASDVADRLSEGVRGEVVICVGRAEGPAEVDLDAVLAEAMAESSLKDAVASVVALTGLPRRDVYRAALTKKDDAVKNKETGDE